MSRRGSGVLLHLTSLPSPFGVGDLGPGAFRFADLLADLKQRYWQILPLNPTEPAFDNSPYHSTSAFAGSPLLISPEQLLEEGLLEGADLETIPRFPQGRVDFLAAIRFKAGLLRRAFERFRDSDPPEGYEAFLRDHAFWLEDHALFTALKGHLGEMPWNDWPVGIRDRNPEALAPFREKLLEGVEEEKFLQYIFFHQWSALKAHCNGKGIQVIGDVPIYLTLDSAGCWAHSDIFKLDHEKKPTVVAGVPPDYFSETGQLWGNPIYRWDALKERGYDWWMERIGHNLKLFDRVRIDHFRGLVAYWEVPAGEENAINGKWVEAPVDDFFRCLNKRFPDLPIIAEDLGLITPEVKEKIERFGLPGMKPLVFAFGDDIATNPYIPHNIPKNSVAYTGTHDNNTAMGWFDNETTPEMRARLFRYLGREVPREELHWELIRLTMMSVADTVIIPLQDILGLGEECRMNRPATCNGNWDWRAAPNQLSTEGMARFKMMTEIYGRE